MEAITFDQIADAAAQFDDDIVQHTPTDLSRSIGRKVSAEVHLKMEHLQRTGSFKTRGAFNKMRTLQANTDIEGVVAASAGNHAQGVALTATNAGFDATIVMPTDAPQAKIDATRGYGADVILHGKDFQAAMDHARSLADSPRTGFVHAYDDPAIVAGQGTIGIEIVEDVPDVDTVLVPIGGGGLIAGIGCALAELAPDVRVVGVQADSAATVPTSLEKGRPQTNDHVDTIADGISTGGISELTFEHIETCVDEVVTVSESAIARAIMVLLERAKQFVEGAGATAVAPLLTGEIDVEDEVVVPVLSGGNLDASMLRRVLSHELTQRDRLLELRIRIDDRPGVLEEISGVVSNHNANIRTVNHHRAHSELAVGDAFVTFQIETSGVEHADSIKDAIEAVGYEVSQIN